MNKHIMYILHLSQLHDDEMPPSRDSVKSPCPINTKKFFAVHFFAAPSRFCCPYILLSLGRILYFFSVGHHQIELSLNANFWLNFQNIHLMFSFRRKYIMDIFANGEM